MILHNKYWLLFSEKILISQTKQHFTKRDFLVLQHKTSILLFENDPLMTPLLNYRNALISYLLTSLFDPFMKNVVVEYIVK